MAAVKTCVSGAVGNMSAFLGIALFTFVFLGGFTFSESAAVKYRYVTSANCSLNARHTSGVDKIRVKNIGECQRHCSARDDCKAINYRPPKPSRCQLYKTNVGKKAIHYIPKTGWLYKEKSHGGASDSCSIMAYKDCNPWITHFTNLDYMFNKGDNRAYGGKDVKLQNDIHYYLNSYSNQRDLYIYPTREDAKANTNFNMIRLATGCHGSQHLVYDGLLFCKKYNNRHILVYSTVNGTLMHTVTDLDNVAGYYAGYSDQCHYDFGCQSDIDMMADESGLYVLWGRHNQNCRISVSRFNMDTLKSLERHWHLDIVKTIPGGAMMRCGRVYMTNHYNENPAYMRYIWDMRTGNLTSLTNNDKRRTDLFRLMNWGGHMTPWSYNPGDGFVYQVNNGQWMRQRSAVNPIGKTDIWRNI